MPKGGARASSGPPPDPNALRRERSGDAGWTTLPAEGREGDPPTWPLEDVQPREWDLWRELWTERPQAVAWEQRGQYLEVALLARSLVRAEQPDASVALLTLVRQSMESLGLTTPGMQRNRWRIGAAASVPDSGDPAKPAEHKPRKSARDRLKVVSDGESG